MKILTIKERLKLCWEILTVRKGSADIQLSSFKSGYRFGKINNQQNVNENIKNHIRDNSITDLVTLIERFKDMRAFDSESPVELPKRRDPSPISDDVIENSQWASYCAGANDLIDTWCLSMVRAFNDVLADMSNAEKELATLRDNIRDSVDGFLVEQIINNDIEFVYFQTYGAAQKFSFNGDSVIHPVRLADLKPNPLLHQFVTREFIDNLIHDRDCIMDERDKLLSVIGEKNAEKK